MYEVFRGQVLTAYRAALAQALPPKPRVAQHWVDASRLTWVGLLVEQGRFQLAYSLGRLVGVATPGLHTSGVFHLVSTAFPAVADAQLSRSALALVPATADGATRAFLNRVVCQLALADVAVALREPGVLPMPTSADFTVALPLRADVLETPSPAPVVHAAVAARVRSAVELLEPALAVRVQAACQWE
jgi:hypothetical protein